MRGLIVACGNDPMPQERDSLRMELILMGLEHEHATEARRSWMSVMKSLPVTSKGFIHGGDGLNAKVDAFYDYIEMVMPYAAVNRPKPKGEAASPEQQDQERLELVKMMKDMVASGEL